MPYVITEACIDLMDRSCVRECPVDCIYEGERQLYVNPLECIDCGACELRARTKRSCTKRIFRPIKRPQPFGKPSCSTYSESLGARAGTGSSDMTILMSQQCLSVNDGTASIGGVRNWYLYPIGVQCVWYRMNR